MQIIRGGGWGRRGASGADGEGMGGGSARRSRLTTRGRRGTTPGAAARAAAPPLLHVAVFLRSGAAPGGRGGGRGEGERAGTAVPPQSYGTNAVPGGQSTTGGSDPPPVPRTPSRGGWKGLREGPRLSPPKKAPQRGGRTRRSAPLASANQRCDGADGRVLRPIGERGGGARPVPRAGI